MHIQLYHIPGACSRVTLTALMMARAKFELTIIRRYKGDHQSPEYLAINPLGQVPSLIIDGDVLTENVAILWTLARLFPEAELLPMGDPIKEGRALSRLAFVSTQLHGLMARIIYPALFSDGSPEGAMAMFKTSQQAIMGKLVAMEKVLASQPWLLGDRMTIADVKLFWITSRLDRMGLALPPGVAAHVIRTRAEPVVTEVLARELAIVADFEADGFSYPPDHRNWAF